MCALLIVLLLVNKQNVAVSLRFVLHHPSTEDVRCPYLWVALPPSECSRLSFKPHSEPEPCDLSRAVKASVVKAPGPGTGGRRTFAYWSAGQGAARQPDQVRDRHCRI